MTLRELEFDNFIPSLETRLPVNGRQSYFWKWHLRIRFTSTIYRKCSFGSLMTRTFSRFSFWICWRGRLFFVFVLRSHSDTRALSQKEENRTHKRKAQRQQWTTNYSNYSNEWWTNSLKSWNVIISTTVLLPSRMRNTVRVVEASITMITEARPTTIRSTPCRVAWFYPNDTEDDVLDRTLTSRLF